MSSELAKLPSLVTRNWWVLLLRGLVGVAFGIVAFVTPADAGLALLLFFSAWLIVNGILALVGALTGGTAQRPWGSLLGEAVLSLVAGVLVLVWPGALALSLVFVFSFWAVLNGVLEIVAAIELRKEIRGEWLMALSGALSIAAGILVALRPLTGLLAIVWIIGAYALAIGATLIALSLRLRSAHEAFERRAAGTPMGAAPRHA